MREYWGSQEARDAFIEGFAGPKGFTQAQREHIADLARKESEDRRYRFPPKQGSFHEGLPPGQALNVPKCDILGHNWSQAWESDDKFVTIQECVRCRIVRQQTKQDWGLNQMNQHMTPEDILGMDMETYKKFRLNMLTKEQAEQEMLLAEPEPEEADPDVMCLWCGLVCNDIEARYAHEDECAPA
jgi:hypothetical protein